MNHRITGIARRTTFVGITCALLLLASCLPVPLGDPDKSKVDPNLAGFWNQTDDDNTGMMYLIAPFDAHCYLIHAVKYEKRGDQVDIVKSSAWRAWITEVKGARFLTLQPAVQLADPRNAEKTYPIAKFTLADDLVTANGLNPNYPKFDGLADSAALARVVEENLNDPQMYVDSQIVLRRLNAGKEADAKLMNLAMP